ncbi:HNH endonuclease signature motif containing protein [Saccharopolyspora indica]|uniref:HNH endonuclease signature motif containing protein n=1 Tax=Saccharopolyspora indica TaxID=1229659 RepID=UPI002FE65E91
MSAPAAATEVGAAVEPCAVERAAVELRDAEIVAEIAEIERVVRIARMRQLQLIAEAGHRGLHVEQGARSPQAWLQGLLNIDFSEAKGRVVVARDVEQQTTSWGEPLGADLPATAAALAAGAIGVEHARVVSRCVRTMPEHARVHQTAEIDAILADNGRRMCPRDLAKLAERIKYLLDQDGAHRDEEAQHEGRELHYATGRDGMLVVKARLDREVGAKFVEALQPLAGPRRETDGEKDPRSAGQRNADGFAAMVDLVLDSDQMPRVGGQRPHLNITIDFDDLKRGLLLGDEGMPGTLQTTEQSITAENVRRIACDCDVLPMVLGGDSLPLDVGTSQRTAPTHIRAALLQRDGVCAFPGCDRPPGTPQAHHVVHWIDGGPTTVENMVMLCAHHHRVVHGQRWGIELHHGRPVFTPPSDVDPSRVPRPGGRALPAGYRETLRNLIPAPRAPEGIA